MKQEGKTFIVTGGTGSIGGATARAILSRGGMLALFDVVPEDTGIAFANSLGQGKAHYFRVDITDKAAVAQACSQVLETVPKGSLAGCVHCAGYSPSRPWSHKVYDSIDAFEKVLKINAFGTFVVDACVADAINSQYPDEGAFGSRVTEERGIIINISSQVSRPVPARCLAYGPSKTTVLGITSGMSDFLGPFGIRVNSVSPTVVDGGMMAIDGSPYFLAEAEAGVIFPRRACQVDEVVSGIIYLMENSMMNDFELRIDGATRGSSNWGGPIDPRSNAPSLE